MELLQRMRRWLSCSRGRRAGLVLFVLVVSTLLYVRSDPFVTTRREPMQERGHTSRSDVNEESQLWHEVELPSNQRRPKDLSVKIYDTVKSYLLFVGHSRTGHTLVASLLDAHPEILVADEQGSLLSMWKENTSTIPNFAIRKYRFFYGLHKQSQALATFGFRANPSSAVLHNKGNANYAYNYHVPGQWQGQFRDKITVIGDKFAHDVSLYLSDPQNLVQLDYIQKNLQVNLKILHVIRNPYDVLATRVLRMLHERGTANSENKVNSPDSLDIFIPTYFKITESIERVRNKYNVLDVHGHELTERPLQVMRTVCEHVGVTCEEDYLDACVQRLYKKPTMTRDRVVWREDQIRRVQEEIDKYSFLRRYSFNSDI